MASDSKGGKHVELIIKPIPPDTVSSAKAELRPIIEDALRECGHEELLAGKEFEFEVERTFPTDEVIKAAFTLLTGIALKVFEAVVVPRLKKRFEVKEEKRQEEEPEK